MSETENNDPSSIGAFPIEHLDTPEEKRSNRIHGWITGTIVTCVSFVFIGFLLSPTAHIERKIVIDAPPASVYTVLNGFTRFNDWSPWADMDPNAQYTYAGPLVGKGAKMAWTSKKMGNGSQEIIAATPFKHIGVALAFDKCDATATYDIKQAPKGVEVTWSFDTDFGMNIFARYMGMFMDGMLGKDYEKGLAKLKTVVEALPKDDVGLVDISFVDAPAQPVAYIAGETTTDPAAIGAAFTAAYGQVGAFMAANRLEMAGPPISISDVWDEEHARYVYKAAIPFKGFAPRADGGPVKVMTTTAGPAIRAIHVGAYSELKTTYETLKAFMTLAKLQPTGAPWDEYVSDPAKTPEDQLITHVYFPVAVAKK
jgi:effector-binding domain-containing protein